MEKLLKIEAPKEAAGCQGSSGFWEEGRLREGISVCVGGRVVWREPLPGGSPRAHPVCEEHSFGCPSILGFLLCDLFDL